MKNVVGLHQPEIVSSGKFYFHFSPTKSKLCLLVTTERQFFNFIEGAGGVESIIFIQICGTISNIKKKEQLAPIYATFKLSFIFHHMSTQVSPYVIIVIRFL